MIPAVLQDIARALSHSRLELPKGSGDARRDSSTAEERIVSWLQNQDNNKWQLYSPNVNTSHNRSWYDVKVGDYYCDIKVSELNTHDNTNAKNAVYYFLTGKDNAPTQWAQFFQSMKENENPSDSRDFYFIVVNKKSKKPETFIVSLKGIAEVKPAHNNQPFQCKWNNCREVVNRDWSQAKEYLLGVWSQSIKKGIETYERGMPTYYPEFFNSQMKPYC